jgi:hypothetical protein
MLVWRYEFIKRNRGKCYQRKALTLIDLLLMGSTIMTIYCLAKSNHKERVLIPTFGVLRTARHLLTVPDTTP